MKNKKFEKKDVYEVITNRVIEQLEKGVIPWRKTWSGASGYPTNFDSKNRYQGMNVFMLAMAGYASPHFMTFSQAKKHGGKVKKGAKGFPVIFFKQWEFESKKKPGVMEKIPLAKYSTVFNIEQIEGIENPTPAKEQIEFSPIETAEKIVKGYRGGPIINHDESRAYYQSRLDFINMPKKNTFESEEEYYSTLFHEMTHSTGHKDRLNRETIEGAHFFGDVNYSKEELVAEFGATFLCSHACIKDEKVFKNSASYIDSWLSKLRNDKKLLVHAASQATKSTKRILGADYAN